MEPHFIVNDFLEKSQKELHKVLEPIHQKPKDFNVHRARFMRELILNMAKAQYHHKHKKEIEKKQLLEELEAKKQQLLEKLKEKELKNHKLETLPKKETPLPPPPPPPGKEPSTPSVPTGENPLKQYLNDKNVKEITAQPNRETKITFLDNKTKTEKKLSKEEINNIIKDLAKQSNQTLTKEKPFLATELNNKKIQANLGTEFMAPRLTIIRIE